MIEDKRLTSKQAADYLGVRVQTLWEWRNRSIIPLPYHKIGPKTFMYLKSDLDEYISKCRVDNFTKT